MRTNGAKRCDVAIRSGAPAVVRRVNCNEVLRRRLSYAGEGNLVIGTDYGHGDTSSELNAIARFKAMAELSPEVKRKILFDNPKALYGL